MKYFSDKELATKEFPEENIEHRMTEPAAVLRLEVGCSMSVASKSGTALPHSKTRSVHGGIARGRTRRVLECVRCCDAFTFAHQVAVLVVTQVAFEILGLVPRQD